MILLMRLARTNDLYHRR